MRHANQLTTFRSVRGALYIGVIISCFAFSTAKSAEKVSGKTIDKISSGDLGSGRIVKGNKPISGTDLGSGRVQKKTRQNSTQISSGDLGSGRITLD